MRRAVIAAVLCVGVAACSKAPTLDDYGELPAFALTDHTGKPVTGEDLSGHTVIANFIFTRCPTVCPVTSMKMQRIAERTAEAGAGVQLVSISVDPEYDTPEVLAKFAANYAADPARWRFATGDPKVVRETVEDGLKIAMDVRGTLPSGAPDIVHGEHFVLIDERGRIRGYYNSRDRERLDALVEHALWLADR